MDYPVYHLDFFGNRSLFVVIAILHVIINHALAVGAIPYIALLERRGIKTGDARWDQLAYKILAVCFIVTTTLGALTGVGIWLTASLVNPSAIGSLLRIFFWFWFFEWIIFCIEVCGILFYFLTWKGWGARNKALHNAAGFALAAFSWVTMMVIVAILGFMMHTGSWQEQPSLITGIFNPIYGPQLLFRTAASMILAGFFGLFLIYFFTARGEFRQQAVRLTSLWCLGWSPVCLAGALIYWQAIPPWMLEKNLAVALATQAFEQWHQTIAQLIGAAVAASVIVALWGLALPKRLPRVVLLVPFVLAMVLVTYFERVREFVRKPYAIADYMYSNGIRSEDYPVLKEDGLLTHAAFVPMRTINDENRVAAGREVFNIACTRCHTTTGVNGVVAKLTTLYGDKPWEHEIVLNYVRNMHNTRPFMPPAPGSEEELAALTDYLISLQSNPLRIEGAQRVGVQVAPMQPVLLTGAALPAPAAAPSTQPATTQPAP